MPRIRSVLGALASFLVLLPLTLTLFSSPPADDRPNISVAVTAPDDIIPILMAGLAKGKAPLPVWAVEAAEAAYTKWTLHRLSQKTERVAQEVTTVLRIVTDLKVQLEAGRAISERENVLMRQLLQAHMIRLDELASQVDAMREDDKKRETIIEELKSIVVRKGCGFGKYWNRVKRRCVTSVEPIE